MNRRKEVEEVKEVNEVEEKSYGVAAVFDVDGTLVALPSLERRFFRTLRYRKKIPARNYFLWLKEAMRLLPRGISAILHGNKMYLRGVKVFDESGEGDGDVSTWHKSGRPSGVGASQAEGQATLAPPPRSSRLPVPTFYPKAIERVAWHAKQGHEIVLLSGTLEPLARAVARCLEEELSARGITATIRVIATRLEQEDGRWTGRVLGEAMFGAAKARAAKRLTAELRLDLSRCFAYGDSAQDRWLLSIVGKATAVNPSKELASFANSRGWPILAWEEKQNRTQRRLSALLRAIRVNRGVAEKRGPRALIA
ncbi:MAG TPA: HAD-IB family phosphatase [Candidatus Acidoferrum sp.]|nr:HAD-IB family phosphatase [Candidatus Acidoferrum sp.]